MEDFIFHRIGEQEKEEIKKKAKQIMDSFSKKLSKIDETGEEPFVERENCEREEGEGKCEELDRDLMFENAPEKNKDFIIAEKGGWEE